MRRLPILLFSIILFGQGAMMLAFGLLSYPQIERAERDIGWVAKANEEHAIGGAADLLGAMFIAVSATILVALAASFLAARKKRG